MSKGRVKPTWKRKGVEENEVTVVFSNNSLSLIYGANDCRILIMACFTAGVKKAYETYREVLRQIGIFLVRASLGIGIINTTTHYVPLWSLSM